MVATEGPPGAETSPGSDAALFAAQGGFQAGKDGVVLPVGLRTGRGFGEDICPSSGLTAMHGGSAAAVQATVF